MRLRYTAPALADLASILDHIAAESPQGAKHVQGRIRSIIDLLTTHPRIGRRTDDPAVRRLMTSPYPYLVFYEIDGDEIIVHAVRRVARDPSLPIR
ncbi:MAG: type II toxin-antitoxin system RelE/ParE family toxin [Rhodopseudomonas sp.]|uniref:type II toxin-antitoxin system RelE/ParE family toxin n=1 Tax=Rhodopseudomonas sp. TaxID=1078 RepID=UPI001838D571|nr:type II toxin-antitoxin system RelE/ParE family toxin [Rhodopseudomonas sp.]NVN88230.1 type II toxin-antitoxin system RelE/ParE family toxin [Rhodopseudomonas sp.]